MDAAAILQLQPAARMRQLRVQSSSIDASIQYSDNYGMHRCMVLTLYYSYSVIT